jgi:hypothetical protein
MAEPQLRQRHPTPARKPFPLPPPLQRMLELGKTTLASPFKGVTADGTAVPGLFKLERTGLSLKPVVEAAKAYLAALSETQRAETRFPLETPMWQAWCNIHPFMMRHGLCLADLDASQRERALDLLRASLSAYGFKTARDVMRLNEHVLELTGKTEEYGEWLYWVSIMGEPSESAPWGFQIDGHHLIVNGFILGDQMVLTPNFMGSEPVVAKSGKYAGTHVFGNEEQKGLHLMKAFSDEQRLKATIGEKPPFDVLATAFHDNDVMPYQGVREREMTPEQREMLLRLISLYTGRARDGHAEISYADAKRHIEETWFAWIGKCDDVSPFYYRIMSPVILIEFDHQTGIIYDNDEHSRNHIHTVVRTPNGNDYGKDLLRLHYAQHDHADPRSPHRQGKA